MPELCRFFGIIIAMYHRDHGVPHFHAKYGDRRASFAIEDLRLLEGDLPRRVTALVLEWAFEHRAELLDNWQRVAAGKPHKPMAPLE